MKIFDYIFYRAFGFYSSYESFAQISSSVIVSVCQLMIVVNAFIIGDFIFGTNIPDNEYILIIGVIIMVINWYRYERISDLSEFFKDWKNEPENLKRVRGWFILLFLGVILALPVVLGILKL